MNRRVTRFLADDSGISAVMLAVMFVVIIGFMALVLDVGLALASRARLQSAVDAGALAGCEQLIETPWAPNLVTDAAQQYVLRHAEGALAGLSAADIQVQMSTSAGHPLVRVSTRRTVPLFFGRMYGRSSASVEVTAAAEGQRLNGVRYAAPFALVMPGRVRDVRYELRNATGSTVSSGTLADSGTGLRWTADVQAPATPGKYDVWISYANEAGVTETLYDTNAKRAVPACLLFTRGAGQPVQQVSSDGTLFVEWRDLYTLNSPTYYWPTISATVNASTYTGQAYGGVNRYSNIVLSGDYLAGGQVVAYVRSRRADAPVKDVRISPVVADPGALARLVVDFTGTNWLKSSSTRSGGYLYMVRGSVSDAYSGDYVELDLSSISHASCDSQPFPTAGLSGMTRSSWVFNGFPAPMHVGDEVPNFPLVSGRGLVDASKLRTDGWYSANVPVVIRISPGRVRVLGFVTATVDRSRSTYEIAAIRVWPSHSGTPDSFDTVQNLSGTNGVMAARLVRP